MKKMMITVALLVGMSACGSAQTKNNTNENITTNETKNNMKPIELNKAEFLKKVANYETNPTEFKYLGDKPALIDFYATWCGPCKAVAPILEDLAKEYGDQIVIYKIDTDKEQELAAMFNIRSIPSLLFVPINGQPQMVQGAMSKADFKKTIDKVLLNK